MPNERLLEVKGLSKSYPGVQALKAVSLELRPGEIHGIIGENGAGKSTLMKILSGRIAPDSGMILLDGDPISFKRPADAIRQGIGMVPQELIDFEHLTVADNLCIGEMSNRLLGLVNRREIRHRAGESLSEFGVELDPALPVSRLSIGYRQVLQIMRMVILRPRILILDEPTASLDVNEARDLFRLLGKLNDKGVSIFFISHHLRELFGFVHTVTVLRDGKSVGTRAIESVTQEELVRMMVGRDVQDLYATEAYSSLASRAGKICLEVRGLSSAGHFQDVSFSLRRGEILGFFGLIGAGRSELFKAILGIYRTDSGEVVYSDRPVRLGGMKDAILHSIGYLPEDRNRDGLFVKLRLEENLIAPQIERFSSAGGILNRKRIEAFSKRMMQEMNIVARSARVPVLNLSGGNQQKVLLGMWAGIEPQVLIVDEPTKGVDVATKQLIYLKLREVAEQGVGIVLISSDLPEVLHLADRVMVMREGHLAGEVERQEATEEIIMTLAVGLTERRRNEEGHAERNNQQA